MVKFFSELGEYNSMNLQIKLEIGIIIPILGMFKTKQNKKAN